MGDKLDLFSDGNHKIPNKPIIFGLSFPISTQQLPDFVPPFLNLRPFDWNLQKGVFSYVTSSSSDRSTSPPKDGIGKRQALRRLLSPKACERIRHGPKKPLLKPVSIGPDPCIQIRPFFGK